MVGRLPPECPYILGSALLVQKLRESLRETTHCAANPGLQTPAHNLLSSTRLTLLRLPSTLYIDTASLPTDWSWVTQCDAPTHI